MSALQFLDPIDAFADALLSIEIDGMKRGEPVTGDPLFNGRIGDGHFSPRGCEVWAERVGPAGFVAPDAAARGDAAAMRVVAWIRPPHDGIAHTSPTRKRVNG